MSQRPSDLSPTELRFHPQKAVRWLSTRVLAGTAGRLLLARVFGAYMDKRELQALNEQSVFDHTRATEEEMWIDYVADTGDGFDATYSVAYLASQPEINPAEPLPRGEILVLGGDQVYPAANWRDYEDRFKGPYQAAWPKGDGALYAIPGNHDWFDGLTAFLRLFGAGKDIGGRATYQTRSYWATRLPYGWWLLGIDAQFDEYLDGPQLSYFTEALSDMREGDPVILCVPRPAWTWTDADPQAYDRVDYFIRTFIEPRGGQVPLILTGDKHHYVHYREVDNDDETQTPRHLVTAGGGGAYLSATHTLPKRLEAPPPKSMARHGSKVRTFSRGATYPSRAASWRESFGVFWRLPLRNPSFVGLLGIVHMLGLLGFLASTGAAVATAGAILGITVAFATPSEGPRTLASWIAAVCHAAGHVALISAGAMTWHLLELAGFLAYVGYIPVAGLAASVVTSAYLLIAGGFNVNDNELFAGQCIENYKCFVRMRLTAEGLTVHPIAVPRAHRRWKAAPDGDEESAWITPDKPIRTHYIEAPFTIACQPRDLA